MATSTHANLSQEIVTSLTSTSSTSIRTFEQLQQLLGVGSIHQPVNSVSRVDGRSEKPVRPRKPVRNGAANRVKSTKSTKAQSFAICKSSDQNPEPLPVNSRRKLATESFNASLKCLTQAVKIKQAAKPVCPEFKSTASSQKSNNLPLQSSSPNKRPNPRPTECCKIDSNQDPAIVADCAITALDCLRQLDLQDQETDNSNIHTLEKGTLILIEKLIGLGLSSQAKAEVLKFHEQYWKRRKNIIDSTSQNLVERSRASGLPLYLMLDPDTFSDKTLQFVSSYHSQVLRLAISFGSQSISQDFIDSVKITFCGSPAHVVIRGVKAGYLNNDKAGQTLKTIAQALLKLYATTNGEKEKHVNIANLKFELLFEALSIRVESWVLLQQNADIHSEFWSHVVKGLKRYETDCERLNGDAVKFCLENANRACSQLAARDLDSTFPTSVTTLLVDIAEAADCHAEALELLQSRRTKSLNFEQEQEMLLDWRKAILSYRQSSNRTKQLHDLLEAVRISLESKQNSELRQAENILLHGARLRRTVVSIMGQLQESLHSSNRLDDLDNNILGVCVAILRGLAPLMFSIVHSVNSIESSHLSKPAYTGFAKVFEATLEAYKVCRIQPPKLRDQVSAALKRCADATKRMINVDGCTLKDEKLTASLESLIVQTSDAYWHEYAKCTNHSDVTLDATKCLEISCSILAEFPFRIQKSARLNVKLEKLALVYLTKKDVPKACMSFEAVIRYHLSAGGLAQAARNALTGPSHTVWSQTGTPAHALGKSLTSLTKLCLTYEISVLSTKSWIYDNEGMAPFERLVMLEAQLPAILNHTFTDEQQSILANQVLAITNVCQDTHHRVYRLRFLSILLQTISKNPTLSVAPFAKLYIPLGLDQPIEDKKLTPLSSYAGSLYHLTKIHWFMQTAELEPQTVEEHVQALSAIVADVQDEDAVNNVIDDLNLFVNQLQAVTDFGKMLDDSQLVLTCLECMKRILTFAGPTAKLSLVHVLTQLAMVYEQLGKTAEARKLFISAAEQLADCSSSSTVSIRWTLTYAEYLLEHNETQKAIETYQQMIAHHHDSKQSASHSGRERVERESIFSQAAQVAAQIAFVSGNMGLANYYAKQGVKLSSNIWQAIEKVDNKIVSTYATDANDSMHNLTTDLSSLSVSHHAVSRSKLKGTAYWAYVELHRSALSQMIDMSLHNGLYQDAIHYAEQLWKIATSCGSAAQHARASTILALIYAKAKHVTKAEEILQSIEILQSDLIYLDDRKHATAKAEALLELGHVKSSSQLLELLEAPVVRNDNIQTPKVPAKSGIKKAPVRSVTKPIKSTRSIKAPPKRAGQKTPTTDDTDATDVKSVVLSRSERFIRQKYLALRSQVDFKQNKAMALKYDADIQNINATSFDATTVTNTMLMLDQALTELSSDAVKCVLAETAVALPVRYRSNRKSGRVSFVQASDLRAEPLANKNTRGKKTASKAIVDKEQVSTAEKLVLDAQKLLCGLHTIRGDLLASDMLHLGHKIQSKLTLISSAMGLPFNVSSTELVLQALQPKDIVQKRERITANTERALKDKVKIMEFSDVSSLNQQSSFDAPLDCISDDLAALPESWTVISITLADNHQELLMSKIVGNRSPFLLRIPLSRSEFEIDGEDFTFANAKAELVDIISEANTSAHDTRGQGSREARKMWYSEREELDERLATWLTNVETIWLGGFRGLTSPTVFDDEVIARFGQSLNQALDKHLLSRQKSTTSKKNKITLHAHVLELFLGLGHPDESEIDDAMTDLLYFVVDILQFSGEHNAYDEIDFDAMLVDTFDAVRCCYEMQQGSTSTRHTILIVDKELESFPWESLSCLAGQSVSRMPSLSSIFERLRRIRDQSSTTQGYTIPADDGAYILNPSSDLASTQATFQPVLQAQLPGHTSSINKPPTESEFVDLLASRELLLYFGHGSGAQYIRGRTVRSLDKCAVTLLMGCSSAKMVECGKFESYGMPGYYIGGMSGCMAVVGTLWDVTDRDIDRFAMKTMVEWGLIEEDELVSKSLEKSSKSAKINKLKTQSSAKHYRRGVVSLDEAVSKGREACLLRYLNGAAPVVYGVPVFLK